MKKTISAIIGALCIFACSCTNELNLTFKKDGSVDFEFSALADKALTKMLQDFATSTGSDSIFDVASIKKELSGSGFSNVTVTSKDVSSLKASGKDSNKKSIIFSSGIVSANGTKVKAQLTPKHLKNFYDEAEESTQMLLDMLLSPIFNDEEMSEDEYVELVSSFYGAPVGQEIKNSQVLISFTDSTGKKTSKKIPLTQLMTLNEPLILEN